MNSSLNRFALLLFLFGMEIKESSHFCYQRLLFAVHISQHQDDTVTQSHRTSSAAKGKKKKSLIHLIFSMIRNYNFISEILTEIKKYEMKYFHPCTTSLQHTTLRPSIKTSILSVYIFL